MSMVKRRQPSAGRARLQVLAASDDARFAGHVVELLASSRRADREAALEALVERPLPEARDALRSLFLHLHADGAKRDQGGHQRVSILQVLRSVRDVRDADIAVSALAARELIFGDDTTWRLRAHGLMLLADLAPEAFPYYAVEHLDDDGSMEGEPANTAFELLAATGNHPMIYAWLLANSGSNRASAVFELFAADAPPEVVQRYASRALQGALRTQDEALATVLVEAIVRLELEAAYGAIADLMFAKTSDELYAYVAMLLAATNRAALLALLEDQLHRGRRPPLVAEALRVRTTPEQAAILKRWEER